MVCLTAATQVPEKGFIESFNGRPTRGMPEHGSVLVDRGCAGRHCIRSGGWQSDYESSRTRTVRSWQLEIATVGQAGPQGRAQGASDVLRCGKSPWEIVPPGPQTSQSRTSWLSRYTFSVARKPWSPL